MRVSFILGRVFLKRTQYRCNQDWSIRKHSKEILTKDVVKKLSGWLCFVYF